MSDATKAVFLSYASQDAEAAKRIADALRAAGVEVWFDQNELVGGDAWDQKIRKQIKECALFVPVVSANTQARREGYFRLEWKLADDRTHLMAKGTPFILPVCVDDTKDWDAIVPDSFMTVQWTRLAEGASPAGFATRVAQLLRGEIPTPAPRRAAAGSSGLAVPAQTPSRKSGLVAAGLVALVVAGGVVAWRWPRAANSPSASPAVAETPAVAAAQTEAQKLTRQAVTLLDDPMELRENFFLADELAQRAVKADPTDGEAWAVAGRVSINLVKRSFDVSAARLELARTQIGRARSLAPASIEGALANALLQQQTGDTAAAEKLLAQLTEQAPGDWRPWLELGRLRFMNDNYAEAAAAYDKAAALAPNDSRPLCRKANLLISDFRLAEADQLFQRGLTLNPGREVYLRRFLFLGLYVYDVPAAKTFLESVPVALRQEDSMISQVAEFYLRTGEGDRALAELKRLPKDFFEDGWDWRPKGYLAGYAHQIAGRPAAAQSEWKQALAVVEKRLAAEPRNQDLLYWQCVLQALTGQVAAAKEGRKVLNELIGETGRQDSGWFDSILLVALGEPEAAIELLISRWPKAGRARTDLWGDFLYAPWFAPIRPDPRIRAMALEHKAAIDRAYKPAAAGPKSEILDPKPGRPPQADEKSVAVLAFANLSDDKANEYFSDGISEELLNVLAKVPGLKVSARTSAFYFKGKEVPVPEIAKQLGVAYVVEGSVRKAGDKVRITAQLIKAADGFHVWSDTFTRDLKDIFAVQDEIAGLIAQQLQLKLGEGGARGAVDPALYELLLQARALTLRESNEDWRQAIALYRRTLEREPRLALAWAEMARTYVQLGRFGGMPVQDAMREARAAAQRALELEPDQPTGLLAMGWVQRTADWDWPAARRSFQRARELAPGNASIMSDTAVLYFNLGRAAESFELSRQAAELDPLNARVQAGRGFILTVAGEWEQALGPLAKAVELAPSIEEVRSHQSRALFGLGRLAEAEAAARAEPNEAYRLVALSLMKGAPEKALAGDRAFADFIAKYGDEMPAYVSMVYSIRGEVEPAFAWLERALNRRDAGVSWIKTNFNTRNLRSDPRWPGFLRRVGLADEQLR